MSQPFTLGVNYWPRRKAMYWWSNFEADEVREEFNVIASLGMNVVRLFLLWDDWQPTPDTVSSERLRDFGTVCDIAAELNLGLDVTFFTGHMSGPNWSPGWLLDNSVPFPSSTIRQVVSGGKIVNGSYRNMFHDPQAISASKLLLKTVVSEYKDHDAIWMWNLGNEPDLFAYPHSPQAGREWAKMMRDLIREIDPNHNVTCGLHIASLLNENGLHVDQIFAEMDAPVMHSYPMYASWAQHNLDPDLVPYTCALVSALCGKPTLMEEWGGCTNAPGRPSEVWEWTAYGQPRQQFIASEEDLAAYVEAVLPRLVDVGATGAMMWCYADYSEDLWDRPPCDDNGAKHERHFGLVRPDGTLKPHTDVIRRFAAKQPVINSNPPRRVELDVTPDEFYNAPAEHTVRLYQQYLSQT